VDRLTIGELAQASGLSPATIRRYGAAGILEPVHIDPHSGYRFYAADQVQSAVLARTLRVLDVPLEEVRAILEEADPASRLARLESHWGTVQEQVDRGRRERDHVARLFSGFQALIDSFEVATIELDEVSAYVRRRVVRLAEVPELTRQGLASMRERAEREERRVLGDAVLRYGWPPERHDVDNAEAPREVEVCLPVSGEGDVVLPGGTAAVTEVHGEDTYFPQLLAAYGAVSQWARDHGRRLLGPALEWQRGPEHLEVGWLVAETGDEAPEG
jgi:DNA-binding transcriptional MerR regulator